MQWLVAQNHLAEMCLRRTMSRFAATSEMEMFGWMLKAVNDDCTSLEYLGNVAGLSRDCVFQ
jgi:hypothetical protein